MFSYNSKEKSNQKSDIKITMICFMFTESEKQVVFFLIFDVRFLLVQH